MIVFLRIMKEISESAYRDLCGECKRCRSKYLETFGWFIAAYCTLNIRPRYECGCYWCDGFEKIDFDEPTKKSTKR